MALTKISAAGSISPRKGQETESQASLYNKKEAINL